MPDSARWKFTARPFAEMTGAHVYTVHTSCEESLAEAIRGKQRGVNVWVETLIQYLLLDRTAAEPNFEGAKNVMSPPLRDKKNQELLWKALADGSVATLATEHAPFDLVAYEDGCFHRLQVKYRTATRGAVTVSFRSVWADR